MAKEEEKWVVVMEKKGKGENSWGGQKIPVWKEYKERQNAKEGGNRKIDDATPAGEVLPSQRATGCVVLATWVEIGKSLLPAGARCSNDPQSRVLARLRRKSFILARFKSIQRNVHISALPSRINMFTRLKIEIGNRRQAWQKATT